MACCSTTSGRSLLCEISSCSLQSNAMWNQPTQILRKCEAVFVLLKHCLCLFHECATTVKSMYICKQETMKYKIFVLKNMGFTLVSPWTAPVRKAIFPIHSHYMGITLVDQWNCLCKASILPNIGITWGSLWSAQFSTHLHYMEFTLIGP